MCALARHVIHDVSGSDCIAAWQELTGEPFFVWGRNSRQHDGFCFFSIKKAFQKWIESTGEAEITIYHDGMGADALGPLDPCDHKVLLMHNWTTRWEKNFDWMIRCTGKLAVGNEAIAREVKSRFEWIPGKYISVIPRPILKDALGGKDGTGPAQRTGIWLHGRSWKRYGNRLRAIVDRWPSDGGQIEIITAGSKVPGWAQKPHVRWSGDLPLEFAALRLYTWDSTLLLNDFSLESPWLLRALELGCFPLVPDGDGMGRRGCWDIDSAPASYEWGDVAAAADLLKEWRENRAELEENFLGWVKQISGVSGTDFNRDWDSAKKEILLSRPPKLRKRNPVSGLFPVGWYERVQRLRSG